MAGIFRQFNLWNVELGLLRAGSLLAGSPHVRDLLTGGAFGPENSMVAVVVCFATAGFLLLRRQKYQARFD